MFISFKQPRFIFVHIFKTGGTSMKAALFPHLFYWWQLKIKFYLSKTGISCYDYKPLGDHASALEIRKILGKNKYSNFYSFAVVRNPWDWQVSLYHFMREQENHPQHFIIKKMNSFEEYITWRCANDVRLQSEFVCDSDGVCIVNKILKLENIQNDCRELSSHLGIPISFPFLNSSMHENYKKYYNSYTKKEIERVFELDIKNFNYKF